MASRRWALPLVLLFLLVGCIRCGGSPAPPAPEADVPVSPAAGPEAQTPPARPTTPRVVVLGDSLTAGLGLPPSEAYPALLDARLRDAGYAVEVINAGVSGDTSADGLRRATWALEGDVRILVLALGANDGLRGLPVAQMRENLQSIIHRARQRAIPVLLVGMEAPPNYGGEYTRDFRQVFADLARENKLPFVPFLLEGVAGSAALNQRDGLHPTAVGAQRIAEHLWPSLEKMAATWAPRAQTASVPPR